MLEPTASVSMRPKSMILPEEVPDIEKVGKFDDDKVEEEEKNIHHDQEGSCWNEFTNFFKNVKYNIVGITAKATIVWAIVSVIAIIINYVGESYASECEREQLWKIPGQTLINKDKGAAFTYTWGLEETTPGSFYIKDKNCQPTPNWYTEAKPAKPEKNPKAKRAAVGCLTLTFSGNKITTEPLKQKIDPSQMWKKTPTDENGYFKLFMVAKEKTSTDKKSVKEKEKPKDTKTYVSATSKDNELVSKQNCKGIIAANVANFRTFEQNTRKVISVLLGFFVATIVTRWWAQTSKIPRLEKLAISLNAIMQEAEGEGPEPMKKVKREILRLAALSYAIVMISISGEKANKPEDVIKFLKEKKGLLKDEEIEALGFTDKELKEKRRIFSATGAAMLKWWLPLNWAAHIVQVESTNKEGGHLLKEGKVIAAVLINIFNDLEDLADYSQRPMPKIAL